MSERLPRKLAFIVVVTILALGSAFLIGRFVVFHKPWRAEEVRVLTVLVGLSAIGAARLAFDRPNWKKALVGSIAVVWLSVGTIYVYSAAANYRVNVPPPVEHVEVSRTSGLHAEGRDVGAAEVLQYFGARPTVPLEDLPRIHLRWFEPAELTPVADELLASRYELTSLPPAGLPDDLSWREDPHDNREWRWELHNMSYVVHLSRAHAAVGNLEYLRRAEELVLDWIEDNSRYALAPGEFVWDDHGTAIRLANWLLFWEVWVRSPLATPAKLEVILGSMLGHARKLASPDFYWERHNHGIDQDRSLLGFAVLFPELSSAAGWRRLALERLEIQLNETISPAGVHLEHSPGYHLYMMERLQDVERFLAAFQLDDKFEIDLHELQARMARFASTTVQPDGHIVPIGDTRAARIGSYRAHEHPAARPWLDFHVSGGATGMLRDTVAAYLDEGYASVRDFAGGTLEFGESLHLFFTAAAHESAGRRGHKHADDLSFVLAYGGRPFLTDPGFYGYTQDANRDFVTRSRAHNVVLIDGEDFAGWDSRLEGVTVADDHTTIRGSHWNYPGFRHTRTIVHVPPAKLVLVDELVPTDRSSDGHEFTQLFHFAPDLGVEPETGASGIIATPAGFATDCPRFHLRQLFDDVQLGVVRGQSEPMLGWQSAADGVLVPASTAMFSSSAREGLFVTSLDIVPCGEGAPRGVDAAVGALTDTEVLVTWSAGDATARLRVDRATGKVRLERR